MSLQTNPQLELAFEYVRNTNKHLFLTGKAGSGKTTFLHQIKAEGTKRMAVVAPTGVAAINAGGMTIHSLFQLPLGIHLPGVERSDAASQYRFSSEKIRLIRGLDLLVIDEISMVRADVLDAIDAVLRRHRRSSTPFGGVQLLMIGDLHQLPPVVKREDWELLNRYYDTPYFFGSQALQQTDYISIELKHIFRQSDPEFIGLLNKVRDNRLDDASLKKLNSRFIPNFKPPAKDGYITLTATNAVANAINARNLAQLPGPLRTFDATIEGNFPESAYPTEATLKIKPGAQVMFIKNDLQSARRYFNGKIGRVTKIEDDTIYVRCPEDARDIAVTPDDWRNVKYSLNQETKQIEEQVLGAFTQYPLKLAWAITIHKSQGLTFERAIIDANAAFAHGQVYVALSRCKSFEGIVLRSPIPAASVKTDPVVAEFSEQAERNMPSRAQLQEAKRECQISALQELFQFDAIQKRLQKLGATCMQHANTLSPEALQQVQALAERARAELMEVVGKFAPQLDEYLQHDTMPEANESLQARLRRASAYFTETIARFIQEAGKLSVGADNKEVAASLEAQLRSLQSALFVKRACFAACRDGFTTARYNRAKVDAELDFLKSKSAGTPKQRGVPKGVPHPVLYRRLLDWREQTAQANGVSVRDVLPSMSMRELVACLPTDNSRLREIPGIGKRRLQRYGKQIIEIIEQYCAEHQLAGDGSLVPPTAKPGTWDTKRYSFELFQAGKSIDEIAAERRLVRGTIEGHLAHFIRLGELDVYKVLDRETVDEIEQFLVANPDAKAADAKAHFGDKYDYGPLKMVISHVNKDKQT